MHITKTHHDSGKGIHAKSLPVTDWEVANRVASEMTEWLNKENGHFEGEFNRAFAMAHCQVVDHDSPLKIFVVDEKLVLPKDWEKDSRETLVNTYFEAQAIFNAEILETPEKIKKKVPKREVKKLDNGETEMHVSLEEKEISNVIEVPEACMSFPHRKEKNVKRYHTIKVSYQYYGKGITGKMKLKTFTDEVSGLKAHILQHECQHFDGDNMFHSS